MKKKYEPINVFSPLFRTEEILVEIRDCLEKGWTGIGFKTVEFEKKWSEYTGIPYSLFLSSNTVGLHLAVNILKNKFNWKDGDEIITTPLTFVSTNHAILYENLKPVFADVDEYLCLDPLSVENKISSKTKAVVFVGIGGNPGRLDKIKEICDNYDLKLILDAAHMSGTFVNTNGSEKHVGSESDISVFSFQAVKNLPTADSGMICFKNEEDYNLAKKLVWLGIDKDTFTRSSSQGNYKWKYGVPHLGFKYHGNSIMASIGMIQLRYLDDDNKKRNKICDYYNEQLLDLEGVSCIQDSAYCKRSSKHLYQILVNPLVSKSKKSNLRDQLMQHFYANQIYPGVHYIDNTAYPMYSEQRGICPNSEKYSERLITLPIHLNLSDEDLKRIVIVLKEGISDLS